MEFSIVAIAADHSIAGFDCGDARRNSWLQTHALDNQTDDYTATYVALTPDKTVIGFYSLSSSSLARQAMPRKMRHGAPELVPIILLGQLAVDLTAQGQRIGDTLVVDAIKRTVQAADIIGCHFLGVHPAAEWLVHNYERFDFALVRGSTPPLMLVSVPHLRQILATSRF